MKGWRKLTRKRLNRQSKTEIHFFKMLNSWGHYPKRNKFVRGNSGKCYFIDFYFKRKRLAIELDGLDHVDRVFEDKQRENDIKARHRIKFLRFTNWDIWNRIEWVRECVEKAVPPMVKKRRKRGIGKFILMRHCQELDRAFMATCV